MPGENFFARGLWKFLRRSRSSTTIIDLFNTATIDIVRVVLGHGASGNAASMKPYVVGFKRRGIDAVAVDLPRGAAEKAVPVFIKTCGRGRVRRTCALLVSAAPSRLPGPAPHRALASHHVSDPLPQR